MARPGSAEEQPIDVVLLVQALARLMSERTMEDLGVDGVRENDGYVFQHLVPGPLPVSQLAERLGVTQQAASKAVLDLERRDLVAREPYGDDARVRLVALTERGWAAIEGARTARRAMSEEVAEVLGAQGAKRFARDLTAVLERFGGVQALMGRRLRPPR